MLFWQQKKKGQGIEIISVLQEQETSCEMQIINNHKKNIPKDIQSKVN
jgi:hypothetical protein